MLSAYLALVAGSEGLVPEGLLYAPVPVLLWAAIRFGTVGASLAFMALLSVFLTAALWGGPFVALFSELAVLNLQQFLFLTAAPYYFVAIVVDQNAGIERSLHESESRFRNLAETAPAMIWMSGPAGASVPGIVAVVKANAYGHGAVPVAKALENAGATMLACADVEEAVTLRRAGVGVDILVFGALGVSDVSGIFEYRLDAYDLDAVGRSRRCRRRRRA